MMGLVTITVPCKLGLEADPARSILVVIKVACSNINWTRRSKITTMNWYRIHQTYVGKKPSTIAIYVLLKIGLHPSHGGFKSKPSCCTAYMSLCKKQPACYRLLTGHLAVVRTTHDPRLEVIDIATTPTVRGLHVARPLICINVLFLHCGLHAAAISLSNTDCKSTSR